MLPTWVTGAFNNNLSGRLADFQSYTTTTMRKPLWFCQLEKKQKNKPKTKPGVAACFSSTAKQQSFDLVFHFQIYSYIDSLWNS